ncbi:hypothetical protein OAH28_02005 [Hyphomicrobiales bacterium]|jgi:hypothetical protein|nr:hypothetical protein [Hyphomicrobiales bacterium]MDC3272716.1 hypothetical protein [Hyphomicrobiales bacterium]
MNAVEIEQAISELAEQTYNRIKDGSIVHYKYDIKAASLVKIY